MRLNLPSLNSTATQAIGLPENVPSRSFLAALCIAFIPLFQCLGQNQLRITEIMYHPAPPTQTELNAGFADQDLFEFIELVNIGPAAISLTGAEFTNGIGFVFSSGSVPNLNPGEYVLVVADDDAFELRYGPGLNVAGEYSGNLANGGERIALKGISGTDILDFEYDDKGDGWYPATDGDGFSLVIRDSSADPTSWANPSSWQPSSMPGGSPGAIDGDGGVIISEIMYHPSTAPSNYLQEYIELHNKGNSSVDLSGWRFTDGVDFLFPSNTTIAANGYLVAAADLTYFALEYPGVQNVVGGWTGTLADGGEKIELANAQGREVDRVRYCDEGDWAIRTKSALYRNKYWGWLWNSDHDGNGKSLELINTTVANDYGQHWTSSTQANGTPGTANSATVSTGSIAPVILDVKHRPEIPGPGTAVTVTATVVSELADSVTVTLCHRIDGLAQPFSNLAMADNGTGGDLQANDGTYTAILAAQPLNTIIEFYVRADQAGNTRTWPAPVEPGGGQEANCLYQVVSLQSSPVPTYYCVMTAEEKNKLTSIWAEDNETDPINAQMNTTFISVDGNDIKVRYLTHLRNRGSSSRREWPKSSHVEFPGDRTWNGLPGININACYPYRQNIGGVMYNLTGVPAQETRMIRLRFNNADYAETGDDMYGCYVQLEQFGSAFVRNHFPDDDQGNLYKKYDGIHQKQTNEDENDFSDVEELERVVDIPWTDPDYLNKIGEWINIDSWVYFVAVDSLMGNTEGGLCTGRWDDDFSLYSGALDKRFIIVARDLDSLMTASATRGIFDGYISTDGLQDILTHPEVKRRYYHQLRMLVNYVFNSENLHPILDEQLGGIVLPAHIQQMKDYISARRTSVIDQVNWYSPPQLSGTLEYDVVMDPASGPWRVKSNTTVPDGVTVRILPGATLIFEGSYGITFTGTGRIVAEGTEDEHITFQGSGGAARIPLTFTNSMADNVLCYVDLDFNDIGDHYAGVYNSRVLMEHIVWSGSLATILDMQDAAIIVRESVFPSVGENETIHGLGMAANGYVVFAGNEFGANSGYSDVIDFADCSVPGRVLRFLNNTFLGGQDDGIDVDNCRAHIEGNFFENFTQGGSSHTSTRNAIAADLSSHITVVRNIFYNNEHDILLKGGTYLTAEHNDFVEAEVESVNFKEPGSPAGGDAYLDGNIFWGMPSALGSPFDPEVGNIVVNRCIITNSYHGLGTGNIDANPLLTYPAYGDFRLLPGSPAAGTGPAGRDMGAMIPPTPSLAITEIMYHPPPPNSAEIAAGWSDPDDFEFIEIQNISARVQYLAGVRFTEGIAFEFYSGTVTTLAPGEHVVLVRNETAFEARYGPGINVAGQYSGNLANDGEWICLLAASGDIIHGFEYGENWYGTTDGAGHSLVIADPYADPELHPWSLRTSWSASGAVNGSPGASDSGTHVPGITINEILTHTDQPYRDAIELYNPTSTNADIGGWHLTDSVAYPTKYLIPTGTVINAGDYLTIYEGHYVGTNLLFNANEFGSAFSLSSLGEGIWLSSPDRTYCHGFEFNGAFNGVSFGRHLVSSGKEYFPSQLSTSLGSTNTGPTNSPVIFSEIMYRPTPDGDEFIEIINVTDNPVKLYDQNNPSNTWKASGIGFAFPPYTQLEGGDVVLLVWDVIAADDFRIKYDIPTSIPIFSYNNRLADNGETVCLMCPDEPILTGPDAGKVAYVVMDQVDYSDSLPWPPGAAGYGSSIRRIAINTFGSDPTNWTENVAAEIDPGLALELVPSSCIGLSARKIFVHAEQGTNAQQQTFQVWNSGVDLLSYVILEGSSWLSVAGVTGSSIDPSEKNTHTISFTTAGLAQGRYTASIIVVGSGAANDPQTITVDLEVRTKLFIAYNDFSWGSGQLLGNITRYTSDSGAGTPPDGSAGLLRKYETGEDTTIRMTVAGGNWDGSMHVTTGCDAAPGTDAYLAFSNKVSCTGFLSYGANVELSFSGMDPLAKYEIVMFANRDYYTDRHCVYRISGANSFINTSSEGAARSTYLVHDDSVTVLSDNTDDGYVVRYDEIDPGEDGEMLITIEGPYQYINAMRLTASVTSEDRDADGMEDNWEFRNFAGTNINFGEAWDDWDNDGMINLHEYIGGHNPTSAASYLGITTIGKGSGANEIALTWQGAPAKTYSIMSTTDLAAYGGAWTTNRAGLSGELLNTTIIYADDKPMIFKVRLE